MPSSATETTAKQATRVADTTRLPRAQTRRGRARLITLDALDGRTAAAQNARALIASLTESMGGEAALSVGERELVTRAALLSAIVTDFETRWVAGESVPLVEYLQTVNTMRRVLSTLGLRRRPRDVTLADYMNRQVMVEEEIEDVSEGAST